MKGIVIIILLAVLYVSITTNIDVSKDQYNIQCIADGLLLYDGIGTDLEYTDNGIVFRDSSGDKVNITNDAQCVVDTLD
jgi:hypothetical protein